MKARVKATDRIIEVMCVMNIEGVAVWEDISGVSTTPNQYTSDELEFLDFPEIPIATYDPYYWNRLEHQAAIAAMQGILSNAHIAFKDIKVDTVTDVYVDNIIKNARAIVEKYKKEE